MSSSRDIFTRISDKIERDRIFKDLCTVHAEITAKVHEPLSDTFLLRAEFCNDHEMCCVIQPTKAPMKKSGELILQMMLGGEKYLCSVTYQIRDNRIYLKTDVDVFHLQRRDDFRLRLPTTYKAYFEMTSLNNKPMKIRLQIIDISGGGCKVLIQPTPPSLKISDHVVGEVHLPDRPAIAINGKIRHEEDDEDFKLQVVGIQFIEISAVVRNRLAALVMDIYRELFARLT